MEMIKKV